VLSAGREFGGEVILTEPLGVETIMHIRSRRATLLSLCQGISTSASARRCTSTFCKIGCIHSTWMGGGSENGKLLR
jgi:hypothetical protein